MPVTTNVRPQRMHTPMFNASSWQLRRPKASLRQARSTVGFSSLKSGLALIAPARTKATSNAAFGVESARQSKFSASRRAMHMNISVGACAPTSANLQSVRGTAAARTEVALLHARSVRRKGSPRPQLSLVRRTLRPNPSVNRTRLPPRAGYLER